MAYSTTSLALLIVGCPLDSLAAQPSISDAVYSLTARKIMRSESHLQQTPAPTPSDFTQNTSDAACSDDVDCPGCADGCFTNSNCYSNEGTFGDCDGKANGYDLGRGFRCWDGNKQYLCRAATSEPTSEPTVAPTPSDFTDVNAKAACSTDADCPGCQRGCLNSKCFSSEGVVAECNGKANGHSLGFGFWCEDGRKDYMCKADV